MSRLTTSYRAADSMSNRTCRIVGCTLQVPLAELQLLQMRHEDPELAYIVAS